MQADNCHTRIYLVHVKTRSSCCFWAFFSSNMKIIFDLFSKMHRLSNNVRLSCNLHCDPISASHHVVILWMHFIVLYSLWNPMALYFHLPSWNRTKYNPWPLISALCFMVYTHTSRTHTHTHTCPYKITSFNLERPSPQLTERVRQKGRDWERWGRCKVINYLWVKSNKRQEFRWAAGILTDRQTDRQTDWQTAGVPICCSATSSLSSSCEMQTWNVNIWIWFSVFVFPDIQIHLKQLCGAFNYLFFFFSAGLLIRLL